LLVRKLEFHDIERFRHGTKAGCIRRITWIADRDTAGYAKVFHEKLTAKLLERLHEEGSARANAQNPELHMGSLTEIAGFADLPRTPSLQTWSIESPPMQFD
ncbi:MAG: hypothetical protein ACKN82_21435, partial [Pirellula sp.]